MKLAKIPKHLTSSQLRVFIADQSADYGLVETVLFGRCALVGYINESSCKVACHKLHRKSINGHDILAKVKRSFDTTTTVKISQLSSTVGKEDIQVACSLFGTVKDVMLKSTYAYVKFLNLESSLKAIEFLNKSIVVIGGSPVSAKLRKRPVYKSSTVTTDIESTHESDHLPLSLPVTISLSCIKRPSMNSTRNMSTTSTNQSLSVSPALSADPSTNSLQDLTTADSPQVILSSASSVSVIDLTPLTPPRPPIPSSSILTRFTSAMTSPIIEVQLEPQPPNKSVSSVTSDNLYHYFRQFGPINIKPVIDPFSPNSTCLTYVSVSDAAKACKNPCIILKDVKLTIKSFTDKAPFIDKSHSPVLVMNTHTFLPDSKDRLLDKILMRTCRSSKCYSNVSLFPLANEGSTGIQVTGSKENVAEALYLMEMEANYHLNKLITKRSVQYDFNLLPMISNSKLFKDLEEYYCVEFFVSKQDQSQMDVPLSFCFILAQCLQHFPTPITKPELFKKLTKEQVQCNYTYSWSFEDDLGLYIQMEEFFAIAVENGYQGYLSTKPSHGTGASSQSLYTAQRYLYDFAKMTQTNIMSKRVRKIVRSEKYMIAIECRGLENDITAATGSLHETLDKPAIARVEVEDEDRSDIMKLASEFCVEVKQEEQGKLTLSGEKDYIDKVSNELVKANLKAVTRRKQIEEQDCKGGPYWEPQTEKVELKEVSKSTKEWTDIENHFKATLPHTTVQKIERIQNKWLWEKYAFCRKRMSKKNGKSGCNEMMLFHGTRLTPPKMIYDSEHGFDFRYGAQNGLYGKGAYFATDSRYSHNYAYRQIGDPFSNNPPSQIFLAYVLTGDSVSLRPDRTLDKPPIKSLFFSCTQERYDSVNGVSSDSIIYVVYDHDKSYPGYLITYI